MKTYNITLAREEIHIVTLTVTADSDEAANKLAREALPDTDFTTSKLVHADQWVQDVYSRAAA